MITRFSSYASDGLFLTVVCTLAALSCGGIHAQSTTVAADAERAIVRSQENLIKAGTLMQTAKQKASRHDLMGAYEDAREAMTMAPSGDAANKTRNALVTDYTAIALSYARELAQNGDFTDSIAKQNGIVDGSGLSLSAESVAKSVLDPSMNPQCHEAVKFLSDLEQNSVFNKTVTPAFAAKRDQVVKLLRQATDLAKTGRNREALKSYEAVLQLDPYNSAARKGMEDINSSSIKYADEAYNETRSRLLWQVEKAWESPPRKSKQGRSTESVGRQQDIRGTDQITAKLNSIIIPKIDLNDSPVSEAVEYLKQKSVEQDPNHKGVNIFLKLGSQTGTQPQSAIPAPNAAPGGVTPAQQGASTTEPHVTLALSHVPLYVALDYISKLCNLKLKVDPYAVSIVPLSEPTDIMVTKEYQVPPTFIPPKPLDSGTAFTQAGAAPSTANLPRLSARYNAQDYLVSQGVEFPVGASANYLSAGSKLVVRNTRDNIDQIDALVDAAMGVAPSQVDIQTKFLEINQNNIQELGFDWLLGPFSIGGGIYGSGGGSSNSLNNANYPFNSAGMNTVGSLRSGNTAISGNSIDSAIAGQSGDSTSPAPGVFSVAGIFTDPQFQMVIHALNQKKGIDLMSAPKVTTKSGVKATVKIVDEFIYPRQYDPPQFSQPGGGTGQGNTGGGDPTKIPPPTVTPAFPRDFTKQDLGVVLDAKPTIGPDGYTIDLELNPKVTDFDGFINYGSPINGVGYQVGIYAPGGGIGVPAIVPTTTLLTTNTINQPVFTVREVNTFVTVWDGQTVALGGLIREDVQKVQDKVPILGDMPLAGRLFRSDADQKLKKNLVIFVTPRILDAEGQPRRGDTEDQEVVTPMGLPQDLPQPTMNSAAIRGK